MDQVKERVSWQYNPHYNNWNQYNWIVDQVKVRLLTMYEPNWNNRVNAIRSICLFSQVPTKVEMLKRHKTLTVWKASDSSGMRNTRTVILSVSFLYETFLYQFSHGYCNLQNAIRSSILLSYSKSETLSLFAFNGAWKESELRFIKILIRKQPAKNFCKILCSVWN